MKQHFHHIFFHKKKFNLINITRPSSVKNYPVSYCIESWGRGQFTGRDVLSRPTVGQMGWKGYSPSSSGTYTKKWLVVLGAGVTFDIALVVMLLQKAAVVGQLLVFVTLS